MPGIVADGLGRLNINRFYCRHCTAFVGLTNSGSGLRHCPDTVASAFSPLRLPTGLGSAGGFLCASRYQLLALSKSIPLQSRFSRDPPRRAIPRTDKSHHLDMSRRAFCATATSIALLAVLQARCDPPPYVLPIPARYSFAVNVVRFLMR